MTSEKMSSCGSAALPRAIRSSGYFRQKAARLKVFCRRALKEHPEGLEKWFSAAPAADLRAELLSYNGVGPETADSMVLYAAGKPSFVIDAYTRRIGERLGLGRMAGYEDWKALFELALPREVPVYNEYHALLVKLGKDFCRKSKPLCAGCPLKSICKKRGDYTGEKPVHRTRLAKPSRKARFAQRRAWMAEGQVCEREAHAVFAFWAYGEAF
jgi:endonuclease-3 related protein